MSHGVQTTAYSPGWELISAIDVDPNLTVAAVRSVLFTGPSVQRQGSGVVLNEVKDLGPEVQSFLRTRFFARAQKDTFTLSVHSSEKTLCADLHEPFTTIDDANTMYVILFWMPFRGQDRSPS
jgi:hypothetical protein